MRAYEQRMLDRRRADQAAAELARKVAEQAAPLRTHDERVRDAADKRIDDLRAKLAWATSQGERDRIKRTLAVLSAGRDVATEKIKADARAEQFRNSASYVNAREHFEAFARTPPPGVTSEDVALCQAILDYQDWPDAETAAKSYWSEVSRAEEAAYQVAQVKADELRHNALKAEHEAAQSTIVSLERRQALDNARANLGASNE
jgi:hypothetical protein